MLDVSNIGFVERFKSTIEAGYLASNPPQMQQLALLIHRLLMLGKPVSKARLAGVLSIPVEELDALLANLPPDGMERNRNGEIDGFLGLTLKKTRHRISLGAVNLYTWCAFDALFLPAVLDRRIWVESSCPASGSPIEIEVSPEAVISVSPDTAVVSLVAPGAEDYRAGIKASFCCNTNFYASPEAFRDEAKDQPNMICLPVSETFKLAQWRNSVRFPDLKLFSGRDE